MIKTNIKILIGLAVTGILLALATGVAFADKPGSAGNGKNKESKDHGSNRKNASAIFSFGADDRRIVIDYFGAQVYKGDCPPGLAKKGNGCRPPGQAKKWKKGYPLKDKYYDLPQELVIRLPVPPLNHRYVRVAGDILMIAIGTSMVVDAMEDIFQ